MEWRLISVYSDQKKINPSHYQNKELTSRFVHGEIPIIISKGEGITGITEPADPSILLLYYVDAAVQETDTIR